MKDKPFFSVVIPVYNSEKYLDECLSSVFDQTCQDFELVLIDDESRDKSPTICDQWRERFPDRVKVIHQKNTGVYLAKRNGIKESSGTYLYVMDNDDLLVDRRALETVREKILDTHCDLVVFNAIDNLETGHLLCHIPFSDGRILEGEGLAEVYDEFLSTKNLHHIWMMVFHRDLFDWDYEYDEPFRMLRDGPFLILPILSHARKVLFLKDAFYYWRVKNQSSASKHYDVVTFFYSIRCLHKRVLACSKQWAWKSDKTEALIRKNYVADVCIAAIKVRSIPDNSEMRKKECLAMMSSDELFRREYSLKNLEPFRIPIAFALYHKQYWLVNAVSSLVGAAKGR